MRENQRLGLTVRMSQLGEIEFNNTLQLAVFRKELTTRQVMLKKIACFSKASQTGVCAPIRDVTLFVR